MAQEPTLMVLAEYLTSVTNIECFVVADNRSVHSSSGHTTILVVSIAAWQHGLCNQSGSSGGYGHKPSVGPIWKAIRVTDARRFQNELDVRNDVLWVEIWRVPVVLPRSLMCPCVTFTPKVEKHSIFQLGGIVGSSRMTAG